MPSLKMLAVLVTVGLAAAADTCTTDITIRDINPTFDCEVIDAKVTVDKDVSGDLVISGPKQFKRDFIVSNATKLLSISSSSLNSVGGEFLLEDLTLLSNLNLKSLQTVNKLSIRRLPLLSTLTFGSSGVSKATEVKIEDTFISDLSGLNLNTVDAITIVNNRRLISFNSALASVNKTLILSSNGNDMQVNLTQLESANEIQLSQIKSLAAPALTKVTSGIKFENCSNLESFQAANLTSVGTTKSGGSLSFINNPKLANISFPLLKKISGDLTIVNNTKLTEITGFPELTSVDNMLLGGNFDNATLPKLDDVKGTITVKSTSNSTDFCKFFDGLKGKVVQGKVNCAGGVSEEAANNRDGLNKTGGKNDKGSGSGVPGFSTAAVFLGLVAGFAQLL